MFNNYKNSPRRVSERYLDDAISGLKSELHGSVLSESARATIFSGATRPLALWESLALLLPRPRPILIAISVPLVLTLALVLSQPRPIAPEQSPAKILASKEDGKVVFTVGNGRRDHHVYKSTDPARFGVKEVPESGGRFSDQMENGIELVFYRVE